MFKLVRSACIVIVSGSVLGCGEDGAGPSLASILGTWTATKIELVRVANPATKTDVFAIGVTASLELNANQTFTSTFDAPGSQADISTGTFTYSAGTLTLNTTSSIPPETLTFGVGRSGNTMTLTGGAIDFDFGTGEEPATLNLTLTK